MARPGVMLYFDFCAALDGLTDRELGQMVRAILAYGRYQTIPQWKNRHMQMMWDVLQPKLDADQKSYETKVAKRRKAAQCRWENANAPNAQERETEREREREIETEIEREREIILEKKNGFTPPSYLEVEQYCQANELTVDPRQFVDYYTATGWRMGNNPIADWQAALRSWEKNKPKTKEKTNGCNRLLQDEIPRLQSVGVSV